MFRMLNDISATCPRKSGLAESSNGQAASICSTSAVQTPRNLRSSQHPTMQLAWRTKFLHCKDLYPLKAQLLLSQTHEQVIQYHVWHQRLPAARLECYPNLWMIKILIPTVKAISKSRSIIEKTQTIIDSSKMYSETH